MVSSWSGDLLESGTVLDGDYLVGQLRQPVLFGDAVEAVTAAGCRRFLELGPDAVLESRRTPDRAEQHVDSGAAAGPGSRSSRR